MKKKTERDILKQLLINATFDADYFLEKFDKRLREEVKMSVIDNVVSSHTLTLAAVATLGLAAFGVDVGVGDNQVALGLALLGAANLAD